MKTLAVSLLVFAFGATSLFVSAPEANAASSENNYANASGKKRKRRTRRRRKKRTTKAAPSFARPYGMAGCGLGSNVMGSDGNQVLASTTNSTSGSQLFGITTGTSNCFDNPNLMDQTAVKMDRFIVNNKVALASDIARGQGETIHHVSGLLGCQDQQKVGLVLKQRFGDIYPNERVTFNMVTDSVITVIMQHESLRNSCSQINMG